MYVVPILRTWISVSERPNKRNQGQFHPRFSLLGIEANSPTVHRVLQGSIPTQNSTGMQDGCSFRPHSEQI